MSEIVQRLGEFIDYKGVSVSRFEKKIGMSNASFGKSLRNNKSIGVDKLENILKAYPEINIFWLMYGEGEMILEDEGNIKSVKNGEPNAVFKLKSDNELKDQEIPLYNIEAAAGLVSLFQSNSDNKPIDTLKIPNLPKCDGAVFVTGDSMYPLLKSGDIVVYKQINDFSSDIFWGEMYLISVEVAGEEYISVKYIQKSDLGERYIKLVSQNQHHQSKDVELNKVRAMALVKASVRINSMG